VTALVAMSCVAVAIGMSAAGADPWAPSSSALLHAGASYGPASLGSQPWRLVSYGLVHVGALHLIGNLVPLVILGPLLERRLGRLATAIIGLASTVGGGLAAAWWHPMVALAGASGALFGLAGALIVVAIRERSAMSPVARRVLVAALAGFALLHLIVALTSDVTDQAAHLGGLVTGVVLAAVPRARLLALPVLVAAIALSPTPADPRTSLPSLRTAVAELQAIDARFDALVAAAPPAPAAIRAALDGDILPAIDRAIARLHGLTVPARVQPRRDALLRYAVARRRAIALFADYLGSNDPALPAAIGAAQAEADRALTQGLVGDQPE